jgi:arabinofuranan 3-O-arabinosyltransferase
MLALLAFVPVRWPRPPGDPARPWQPGPVAAGLGVLAAGGVIAGITGVVVVGAALGVRYVLRNRSDLRDAVTVGTSAGALILAGAVLSQNPWRSVDGYAGHSAGVQLLALISVAALASTLCRN